MITLHFRTDKTMKRLIFISLLLCLFSCKEEESIFEPERPIFILERFIKVDSICTASIKIKGLRDKFSVDGVIKADEIKNFSITSIQSNGINFFIEENKVTIWGEYAKEITIKINWICKENHQNYLVGWHLVYGMGQGCTVLMINLDTK